MLRAQPQLVAPFEVDRVLHDIVFRNEIEGYALANSALLHTTDAGTTWREMALKPPAEGFTTIYTAVAVFGENGLLLVDTAGRFHSIPHPDSAWTTTLLEEQFRIGKIEVIDSLRWFVVAGPSLLSTTDGGKTYREFTPPHGGVFAGVDVTDASLIHAYQDQYKIWRSADGGETWNILAGVQSTLGTLIDVHFSSPDTGFVASLYPWGLYTTVDGGETWRSRGFEYPSSIALSKKGIGAYTAAGYMRISRDGGMSWPDSIPFPKMVVGPPARSWSIHKVVAVGDDFLYLLLSDAVEDRSLLARIDVPSGVDERSESRVIPGELDLSQTEQDLIDQRKIVGERGSPDNQTADEAGNDRSSGKADLPISWLSSKMSAPFSGQGSGQN